MKAILCALAVAFVACASDDVPDWPEVSTLYEVGADVTCTGAVYVEKGETSARCSFEYVLLDGAPRCWVIVDFTRPDAFAEWTVSYTWVSSATCD